MGNMKSLKISVKFIVPFERKCGGGKRDKPDPAFWRRLLVQIVSYRRHYFKMFVFRNRRQMQLSLTEPIFDREVTFVNSKILICWFLLMSKAVKTKKIYDLTFILPTENQFTTDFVM